MITIKELEIDKKKLIESADNYEECKRLFDVKIKTIREFLVLIDEMDTELMFTDIKDIEKNEKLAQSDELMELFGIFWDHVKVRLKQKIEGEKNG